MVAAMPDRISLGDENENNYDRLFVNLEAGLGSLQILLAACDNTALRQRIIQRYEEELESQQVKVYHLTLDKDEPSLLQALIDGKIDRKSKSISTVMGAEKISNIGDRTTLDSFLGYLQWTREALRDYPMPIVLWVPSALLPEIAKLAPDFWSWRGGAFTFKSTFQVPVFTDSEYISILSEASLTESSGSVLSVLQLEDSLAEAIKTWGEDSANTEPIYAQLGEAYAERLRNGKAIDRIQETTLAETYFNKAIALQKRYDRKDDLAYSLNSLGYMYSSQGRYAEAEPLFKQALALRQELLGDRHPDIATSLNNLALLYKSQGRYEEADPLFKQALALRQELLGDRHPDVATSLNNLAALYQSQGRYAESEPLFKQTLALMQELLGDRHPSVAGSLNNLAGLYSSQGRYAEAEPLFKQSLAMRQELLGDRHPSVAGSLFNLAGLYHKMERPSEALNPIQRSIQIYEQTLGVNHPKTKAAQSWLAPIEAKGKG